MHKIPIYQPDLSGNEKKYVNECLDTTWISSKGRFVQDFESQFASYIGVRYASSVCNGTVALHVALLALGVGPGDEVIVPTLTYIAPVNAIRYVGATPVFVDSLEGTWQMDPEMTRRKVGPRTRAILAVHLYGHPCEMDELVQIAGEHNLFLIEDCAEAHGSEYKGQRVGSFGDIATFSFYGNKTISTGEGGMLLTDNPTLWERAKRFRGQGLAQYREYWHDVIGYNYRMTNICAAIGLAQLERIDTLLRKKRQVASWYTERLKDTEIRYHEEADGVQHTYWMYSVLVPRAELRDGAREALQGAAIETRPIFYPIHTMPMYADKYEQHPIAEDLSWRGINLPSWPGLQQEQVDEVCTVLVDALRPSA